MRSNYIFKTLLDFFFNTIFYFAIVAILVIFHELTYSPSAYPPPIQALKLSLIKSLIIFSYIFPFLISAFFIKLHIAANNKAISNTRLVTTPVNLLNWLLITFVLIATGGRDSHGGSLLLAGLYSLLYIPDAVAVRGYAKKLLTKPREELFNQKIVKIWQIIVIGVMLLYGLAYALDYQQCGIYWTSKTINTNDNSRCIADKVLAGGFDLSICDQARSPNYYKDKRMGPYNCYSSVAVANNKVSICRQLPDQDTKNGCFLSIVLGGKGVLPILPTPFLDGLDKAGRRYEIQNRIGDYLAVDKLDESPQASFVALQRINDSKGTGNIGGFYRSAAEPIKINNPIIIRVVPLNIPFDAKYQFSFGKLNSTNTNNEGAIFDEKELLFQWTPKEFGYYKAVFTVTDQQNKPFKRELVLHVVENPNFISIEDTQLPGTKHNLYTNTQQPMIWSPEWTAQQTHVVGQPFQFKITVTDPGGALKTAFFKNLKRTYPITSIEHVSDPNNFGAVFDTTSQTFSWSNPQGGIYRAYFYVPYSKFNESDVYYEFFVR